MTRPFKFRHKTHIEVGHQEIEINMLVQFWPGNLHVPVSQLDEFPQGDSFEVLHADIDKQIAPQWLVNAIQADIDDGGPIYDECCNATYEDAL